MFTIVFRFVRWKLIKGLVGHCKVFVLSVYLQGESCSMHMMEAGDISSSGIWELKYKDAKVKYGKYSIIGLVVYCGCVVFRLL